MKALGSYFQSKREEQGYSIEDVARKTNISHRYIEAIEQEDFDDFPAGVYAKGFIRNYARFLNLDQEALVMEYNLNFEAQESPEEDTSDRRSGWGYVILLIGLLILGVMIVVFRFAWIHPEYTNLPHSMSGQTPSIVAEQDQRNSVEIKQSVERLKLRVVSTQKTYIYAVFDGLQKREMVLLPGEQRMWEAEETIRIRTANPGGLRLYHGDTELSSLGRTGEVIDKVIQLKEDKIVVHSVLSDRQSLSDREPQ